MDPVLESAAGLSTLAPRGPSHYRLAPANPTKGKKVATVPVRKGTDCPEIHGSLTMERVCCSLRPAGRLLTA